MGVKLDLSGQIFGRLKVLAECSPKGKRTCWICLCSCGNFVEVLSENLRGKVTKSCGCLQRGKTVISSYVDSDYARDSISPIYSVWSSMKDRCYNKKNKRYAVYGERGITICSEWLSNFKVFKSWCLTNGYKIGLQIDRRDNDKSYRPSNCRFVTSAQNNFNRRTVISSNKSSYCGVFIRASGKCRAFVRYERKLYHVGTYNDVKVAAIARDKFIIKNGWPHKLNFPELRDVKNTNTK